MKPHSLLIAATLFAATTVFAQTASAKRLPPPTSNICNKTTRTIYLATANAGRGSVISAGWRVLRAGACKTFRDDAFYFRGKHKVVGLSKNTHMGCIKKSKPFSIMLHGAAANRKSACAAKGGFLAKFTVVSWKKRSATINILR